MIRILALLCIVFSLPAMAQELSQPLFQLHKNDVEQAVSAALVQKGAGEMVVATIQNPATDTLYSHATPIEVEIHGLQFDAQTSRWQASMMFMGDGKTLSAIPVSGRFQETKTVAVLKKPITAGQVIEASDVEMKAIPVGRIRSDMVTDASQLIGKAPARSISPQRPLREHEVGAPAVIKKNSVVRMVYSRGGIELAAQGMALSDGELGRSILVKNISSNKTVAALVKSADTVEIMPLTTQSTAAVAPSQNAVEETHAIN